MIAFSLERSCSVELLVLLLIVGCGCGVGVGGCGVGVGVGDICCEEGCGSRAWYVTRAHAHEAKNQSERDQTDRVLCNSFLRSTAI